MPPFAVAPQLPHAQQALDALAAAAARDVALLGDDAQGWVPERPGVDHDVLIVGGGQTGCAVAFALRRAGVTRTSVIDAAPAGREGVWRNTARMRTLRSAKTLPGPEGGIAPLSFRAWYEAKFGALAYEALVRCGREDWADYVEWFRKTVQVPVRNEVKLLRIEPMIEGFRVHLSDHGIETVETVRKIVLATGMAGGGRPHMPALLAALPAHLRLHSEQEIDFGALQDKRIGILGAASAAFDAAATAVERGALSADLFCRSPDLNRVNTLKAMSYAGVLDNFHDLPDAARWELMSFYRRRAVGPIADTVRRATGLAAFRLHLGEGWTAARAHGAGVEIVTPKETYHFDVVIAGTGYDVDLSTRPELEGVAEHVALWRDRYTPPTGLESTSLGLSPYLDGGFAFQEKVPGQAPYLKDIHLYNMAATTSHARGAGDIGSLKHGVPRLVRAISRDLFLADAAHHVARLKSFDEPDLTGEEYARPDAP
ncbi:NAD(P)/FAD-dependent oxidoreductase [Aquabacter sp. L1I39]|uniref:flavin-containing monooxygenase n=1 Tax=Aquabacter sp. L1I39 TaxID=2820278 RepID=UPI001ADA62E2|nr:NAD(P)/FAD-dependent oxidoreductase [Aquabacter sp. L1I39]QTL05728.1 NAD(P)/FAD-dependent oxidoreductase [Aquabacter sp. L1I39]